MTGRSRFTAAMLGLMAGTAACAKGEMVGGGGAQSSTGGATSAQSSSSSSSSSGATGGMSGTGGMATSSSASGTSSSTGTGGTSPCGNGKIDPGEACDGMDFGGATCQSLGLGAGMLACTAACHIVVSGCDLPDASTALARPARSTTSASPRAARTVPLASTRRTTTWAIPR